MRDGTVSWAASSRQSLAINHLWPGSSSLRTLQQLCRLPFLVKPPGFRGRLDKRLRLDRLGMQMVAAGLEPFDRLQRQSLLVAAANVIENFTCRVLVHAER